MSLSMFVNKSTLKRSQPLCINLLDIEQILQFAENQNQILSQEQKEQLINICSSNKSIQELAMMLNEFDQLKDNFAARAGLSNKEFKLLRTLMEERKQLKEMHKKDKYNTAINKAILLNAKKLLPLEHILEWWSNATRRLNETDTWERLHHNCISESKKNNEPESILKKRLRDINSIKNEWETYLSFANYSSAKLLKFYRKYLNAIDERIQNELKTNSKLTPILTNYLSAALNQIQELRKQVLYSMIYRLRCAEYYNDIKCDDLLAYTCDRIEQTTNTQFRKTGNIPNRRRSLGLNLLPEFIACISEYCKTHKDEKIMESMFNLLRVNKMPPEIQTYSKVHPALVYFANTYPNLIQQAREHENIIDEILSTDCMDDKLFVLNILINNLKYATNIHPYALEKNSSQSENKLGLMLLAQQKNYKNLMRDISQKIMIETEMQMNFILENLFNNDDLDSENIKIAIIKIKKAAQFNKKYLGEEYFLASDIIYSLANKIKEMLANQQEITHEHGERIANLLIQFFPHIDAEKEKILRHALKKMPKDIEKLNQAKQEEFLHFITNHIETPLLSEETLMEALNRHKEIAKNFHEKWIDSIVYTDNTSIQNDKLNLLALYIKNVLLNLIHISPYINLDNFDNNPFCIMLSNLEKRQSLSSQKNHLYFIKNDLEKNICSKINDAFLIKKYLFEVTTQRINLTRLSQLLERISIFFSGKENKEKLEQSIANASYALTKIYCINILENDSLPDINYLITLNGLFDGGMINKLRRDTEIINLINNYIDTYTGHDNHLANFFISLTPLHHSAMQQYVEKRLRHIKACLSACQEDYAFFFYFCSDPKIASLFSRYQDEIIKIISSKISEQSNAWNKDLAHLIELFGSHDDIMAYREKRIIELLNLPHHSLNDDEGNDILNAFLLTINQSRSLKGKNGKSSLITTHSALRRKIKEVIATQTWSLPLEYIVSHYGSQKQSWQLHYNFLNHHLLQLNDFTKSWVAKKLNQDSSDSRSDEQYYFTEFLGEKNIKRICKLIESIAQPLIDTNTQIYSHPLPEQEYKKLIQMIHCLQPLSHLYQRHGNHIYTKNLISNLDAVEKKLDLHYKLSGIISQNLLACDIKNNDLNLHNLTLTIIQSINKFTYDELPEDQNINQYLSYLNTVVLADLEKYITTNQSHLKFQTLSTIINLLLYLTSDDLKKLLFTANHAEIQENPQWLILINHLNEYHIIREIENTLRTMPDHIISDNFEYVISFAKRLTAIKKLANRLLKKNLYAEAGIILSDQENMRIACLAQTKKIKHIQLIKLWSVCAEKLQKHNLPVETTPQYIFFIIKFLNHLSNEILLRAKENPSLLNRFISLFSLLPDLQMDIQASLQHAINTKSTKYTNALWSGVSNVEKMQNLLLSIAIKALSLQLIHKIEKYVAQKISTGKLSRFRSICNDEQFNSIVDKVTLDTQEVQTIFGMKNHEDALKIICMMKIHAKLSVILQKGSEAQSAISLTDKILKEVGNNQTLALSKSFMALLSELNVLAKKYFSANNDSEFLRQMSNKHFSLSFV